jgi:hypothetical protein
MLISTELRSAEYCSEPLGASFRAILKAIPANSKIAMESRLHSLSRQEVREMPY